MIKYRIIEKPAFDVIGKKTWISGQDMEVYFPGNDDMSEESYCEFWLPITKKII